MIEQLSFDEWKSIDAEHPAPTFFARPAWAAALATAFSSMEPMPLVVSLDGRRVLVPAVRTNGGRARWKQIVAFPLGTYTCVLDESGTPAAPELAGRALAEVARAYDAVELNPWPLAPVQFAAGWKSRRHQAAVIDLADGADVVLAHVDGVSRRMAGQATRRGVLCAPFSGEGAVDVYFDILQEAAADWGLANAPYPKRLLEALRREGGDAVEVWLARHEGRAIAGGVVLYGSQEMFFWSAAMRRSFGKMRPSNALNVALIRAAADRGVRWYNLGSSEGLPGVERFKHDLGAQDISYASLSHERPLYNLYSRLRTPLRTRAVGANR